MQNESISLGPDQICVSNKFLFENCIIVNLKILNSEQSHISPQIYKRICLFLRFSWSTNNRFVAKQSNYLSGLKIIYCSETVQSSHWDITAIAAGFHWVFNIFFFTRVKFILTLCVCLSILFHRSSNIHTPLFNVSMSPL